MEPSDVKKLPAASALLHADGYTREQIERPMVGIVYSQNDICPGHLKLDELASYVARGVSEAGGTPVKMNAGVGVCDGIAMGHNGMKYSLPTRELNADAVEAMVRAHPVFDGLVLIGACDKNIPGYLMASARLDMPTVFVTPGPMNPGNYNGKVLDVVSTFAADAQYALGKMGTEEYDGTIENACPGHGSCAGFFTANTMQCLTEAMGMSLPGMATAHATDSKKYRLAAESGRAVMKLIEQGITARDILTRDAFYNAFVVDMAMGGSTNTVLHIPAIAKEAGYDISLLEIDAIGKKTPTLVKISPASASPGIIYRMIDLDRAGGIPVVMKRLGYYLHDNLTVEGSVGNRLARTSDTNSEVIKSTDNPYSSTGGIAILYGSLAPKGAVVKESGIDRSVPKVSKWSARVFESEEEATAFIKSGKLEKGQVIAIRNEGPAGGPGMREMLYPTSAITGLNMGSSVAVVTDGRFSGGTSGPCIGHITPEAYNGGPIALLRDGDSVVVDLNGRELNVLVGKEELEQRRKDWKEKYRLES